MASDLDGSQALQGAYDDNNHAFRVEPISQFVPWGWDYVSLNSSGSTQDVYKFYVGGSGGTLIGTVTINYTDSTKDTITNAART